MSISHNIIQISRYNPAIKIKLMVDTADLDDLDPNEDDALSGSYTNSEPTNIQYIAQDLAVMAETLPTQIMVTVDQYFQLLTDPLNLLDHLYNLGLSEIGDIDFYQYANNYNIEVTVLCHQLLLIIKSRIAILEESWDSDSVEPRSDLVENWYELYFKRILALRGFSSGSGRLRLTGQDLRLLNEGRYDEIPLPSDVTKAMLDKVRGGYKSEITVEMATWTFWRLALKHRLVILKPLEG